MQLFAFGISHHSAPIEVREQFAIQPEHLSEALTDLKSRPGIEEAAILSTCNRTEVYCNTFDPERAVEWLADYRSCNDSNYQPYLATWSDELAVRHTFRVASGLDSMVVGEPQILGQLKHAVRCAAAAGTMGVLLHKLFQRSFSIAKAVRTQTEVGARTVSMAAAAVKLAEQIFPGVAGQRVLLIGAGEMIEASASHFAAKRPKALTVANRTLERGQALAQRFNGEAIVLADLAAHLAHYDIIVTCTSSSLPIIGKGLIESAIRARKHRPIFLVDLAVPRDVEPEVKNLDDVFLYTVDDLGQIIRQGVEHRQTSVLEAEAIITSGVEDFLRWLDARKAVPAIRALRQSVEDSRRAELALAMKRLENGDDAREVLEALSHSLSSKFLHLPTQGLEDTHAREREELLALLARLHVK